MTKTFKEVFPTLKLDKDMENLLENADVTRISVNHARDFYKIYVKAKRLIFKKNIWKLEESIKKQIFKSKDITVKIIESYELSSQYTPKTLFDVYFDSILDEITVTVCFCTICCAPQSGALPTIHMSQSHLRRQ